MTLSNPSLDTDSIMETLQDFPEKLVTAIESLTLENWIMILVVIVAIATIGYIIKNLYKVAVITAVIILVAFLLSRWTGIGANLWSFNNSDSHISCVTEMNGSYDVSDVCPEGTSAKI